MNIQDIKSNTTWQEASNTINNNNNKISLAIATLENATLKNRGYFTSVEKLKEAVPNPTIGSKAYVGTSEPYAIYIVENGVWVDSGYTGGDEIVANITTDRIEDGAVTSEKIATSAFDDTLSVSGKIAPADVVGEKLAGLDKKVDALALGEFYGYFPDSISLPTDISTPGYAYVGLDNPYKIWNFNGESWSDSGTTIDMNDADEEDITRNTEGKLQFKDRSYGDGMGYVILRKNQSFAEQITKENTIYEIRYNFDLNSTTITIPQGCIFKFEGGKLSNGKLIGTNTLIEANEIAIFDNVKFAGIWNNTEVLPQWFGAVADNKKDCSDAVQTAIECGIAKKIFLPYGAYRFYKTLYFTGKGIEFETYIDTKLDFYTSDACVIIGKSQNEPFDSSSICGGRWKWLGNGAKQDIFKIVYTMHITFKNVTAYYGKNGFNCFHNDFVGMYYGYFSDCLAQWNAENGFFLQSPTKYGINAVSLQRCSAGSNGHPAIGQPTTTINELAGNGIVVNGTSFTIIGCTIENNAGRGILVPKDSFLDGCLISGTYFESNLGENVKVEKGGNKRNVLINTSYQKDSSINIEYSSEERNYYNIQDQRVQEIYDKKDYFFVKNINNKTLLSTIKFPAIVNLYSGTYSGVCTNLLEMNIEGQKYLVCYASEVFVVTNVDLNTGTITLDKPVSSPHIGIYIVSDSTVAYRYTKAQLQKYPLPLCSYDGNPANKVLNITIDIGNNTFNITDNISAHPNVKVGDVVYTIKSNLIKLYEHNFNPNERTTIWLKAPSVYKDCPPIIRDCLTFKPVLTPQGDMGYIEAIYHPIFFGDSLSNIEKTKGILPTLNPSGPTGRIEGLQNNVFFTKGYAASNYLRDGTTVEKEGDNIIVTNPTTSYGLGYCVSVKGTKYIVSCKCDTSYTILFAEIGNNGNIVSHEPCYNNIINISNSSEYLIVVIRPNENVDKMVVSDIYIEVVE